MVISLIKRAFGRQYLPLNAVEISASRLKGNLRVLRSIDPRIDVFPVLKSNAYGHGLVQTAKVLNEMKPPFFCVDSIYEAYKLERAKIKTKILVMGYVDPRNLRFRKLPFSFATYDKNHFDALIACQPDAKIHIFVDTGMGREGIPVDELESFLMSIPEAMKNNIEGLMSHFASSDRPSDPRTKKQVANFRKAVAISKEQGINPAFIHLSNSSGLLNSKALGIGKFTNAARCGIAVYGIDPEGKNKRLMPAANLVTHIAQIKKIRKGGTVGYDFTFKANRDMKTAVLPIGYNDGVDRELSNMGRAIVRRKACPVVGRVSMNLTVIEVTNVRGISVGDRVEIRFNPSSSSKIPYEFLVHLNPEIKRVVV